MFLIADLLKDRKIPGLKQSDERHICADTASALLKMKLSAKQFKYEEGRLSLAIAPLLKTELMLRRAEYESLLAAQGLKLTVLR